MVDLVTKWQAADGRALSEARSRGAVVPVIIGPPGKPTIYVVDELPGAFKSSSVYFVGPQRDQYVVDDEGNAFQVTETPSGNIDLGEF